jgi:hypothetical protein
MLSIIIAPKRDKVTGEWRKLGNDFNDLYPLPNSIRVIKSRMRWTGNVAGMRERKLRGRDHLEDRSSGSEKGSLTGLICLRIGTHGGLS